MGTCPVAGVIWQHLHYIVGLQRLGHKVWYVEDTSRYPYDPEQFTISNDLSYVSKTLTRLSKEFGFEDSWCFCGRYDKNPTTVGMSLAQLKKIYKECDAAFNICGSHEINDDLLSVKNLVYVESDPGLEQIKIDKGDLQTKDYLTLHSSLFTFGENIGKDTFPVPLHDMQWMPTRQPVVIDLWKKNSGLHVNSNFTSICNWNTEGKKDITWNGEKYLWSKSLEFLKFLEVPIKCDQTFELATDIKKSDDRVLFERNNWHLVDPHSLNIDIHTYKNYICSSKGEFTTAKDQYVRLNTGWFSDRSACYLAAGRPVITQDTGFCNFYGGNEGLFSFKTIDDILNAVNMIESDYNRHSKVAYEIANQYFEAKKVLSSMIERIK
jgi:hypothetical protein